MTLKYSNLIFSCLEALIFSSFGAFVYAVIVPSLFTICVGPPNTPTCAFFGVFNLYYKGEKFEYGETTGLFMAIRGLVLICAVLIIMSALAAIHGYFSRFKVFGEGVIFLTVTALIILSIVYTAQWFQSILTGSFGIEPFRFHDLRPISQNISLPYFMVSLYPMIFVFFFMGFLIAFEKKDGPQVQKLQNT
ncbi:hypothetical protein RF11_13460 [Thelohanellus kitauei]|uniref:Uncharacterized protein n=1 Tax=Thelohanellus kitauei TaxID=669202 RepID=A0A0C2MRT5_THEKT|nr:hypothetical protein RF11_13460 [Thelohanellus kitauei]